MLNKSVKQTRAEPICYFITVTCQKTRQNFPWHDDIWRLVYHKLTEVPLKKNQGFWDQDCGVAGEPWFAMPATGFKVCPFPGGSTSNPAPCNGLGKVAQDASSTWVLATHVRTWNKLWAPDLDLVQFCLSWQSGSESADKKDPSMPLHFFYDFEFQIKKYFKQANNFLNQTSVYVSQWDFRSWLLGPSLAASVALNQQQTSQELELGRSVS